MTKLEIFNPDGSLYWTEHFNSFEQGKEWLLEEKTRPYWNKDFTFTLVDSEQPWLSLEVRLEEVVEEFPGLEPRFIEHLDTVEDATLKAQVLAEREAQAQAQAALAQQQAARNAAKAYLNDTDWYVVRFMETGREIPADVTVAREQARAAAGE